MGIFFGEQRGTGVGFASIMNKQNFTNEDLLEKLSEIKVSFGTPEMGDIMGTQSVLYRNVTPRQEIFVRVHRKKIIMGALGSSASGQAGNVLDTAAMFAFDGEQSDEQTYINRAVEELADIIDKLENGESVTESTVLSSVKTSTGEKIEFYMNQKVLSIKPKFDIFNEDEEAMYHVEGDITGHVFSIQKDDEEVLKLKKKLVAVMPEYTLLKDGNEIGKIKKKLRLLNPELVGTINGKDLKIGGNLMGCNFDILVGGTPIGQIDTQRTVWADCYRISVLDEAYQDIMIAFGIICDAVVDAEQND